MLRKAIISVIILILAVTVWGAAGRLSASQPASVDAAVPPNANFGLCFVSAADNLADETRYAGALETGARWDRWPLYWYWVDEGGYVGPHSGGYHDYDTLVIQDIEHGLTPIAILLGTADQRATGGSSSVPPPRVQDKVFPAPGRVAPQQAEVSTAASPPVGLFEPIFADGTDIPAPGKAINRANSWADFVSTTVQRYKPGGDLAQGQSWASDIGIRYWEIWNEPDLNDWWSGTVEEYYRLLEVGYKTIEAVDPEATVLLGGLAFFEKEDWLSDLLAQTGGDPTKVYFDVLSSHHLWNIYHGGTDHWLWQTRNTLRTNGLSNVPIWITESGVPVWDDFPATEFEGGVPSDSPIRGTMEEQAAYVIESAALAFHYGVERYYHFMLHDDCGNVPIADAFGLRQNFSPHDCNPPGMNPNGKRRPSYAAYQLIVEQFRDLTPLWREEKNGQDQIAFYRADDKSRVLTLWATGGVTVTTTVSATGDTGQLYWIESISSPLGATGITRTLTLTPTSGVYTLTLPPATNQNSDPPSTTEYFIGGRPYLLVERDTLPPTSSADGRVTDNAARPVAGAQVALTSEAGITYTVVTDEGGLWRVEDLALATYTVTASAPGYGQWPAPRRLALSELTILDFDLNLPPLTNLVANADFEAGLENWMPGGSTAPQISGESFDGQQALVLGKDFVGQPELGGGGNSTLHQSINIPSDTTSPHLSFVYRLVTEETVQGSDWFEAIIIEGDEVAYLIQPGDEWQNTDGWRQFSFDLSPWQGHAFDLYFNVWQSSAQNATLVYVDEVSVGSARLPLVRIFLPLTMKNKE